MRLSKGARKPPSGLSGGEKGRRKRSDRLRNRASLRACSKRSDQRAVPRRRSPLPRLLDLVHRRREVLRANSHAFLRAPQVRRERELKSHLALPPAARLQQRG